MLAMKKLIALLAIFVIASCGMSDADKEEIAIITCNVMGESRNMDAAMRIKELNAAREKIGEERFLLTDAVIKESMKYSLCKYLVLNDSYDEKLNNLKAIEAEQKLAEAKIKAEKQRIEAEKQRIAAEKKRIENLKPRIEEEFYSNGNLKTRVRFDRGKENGLTEVYFESGQIQYRVNMKDGLLHGIFEEYLENDQVPSKSCYQNEELVDMSYCEE
jgi:hypothetical protein